MGSYPPMELNEDERRFIAYLSRRGGSAYLYEIRRALGMPRSSAWRMARRLADWGFIRTVKAKVGGRQLIRVLLRRH